MLFRSLSAENLVLNSERATFLREMQEYVFKSRRLEETVQHLKDALTESESKLEGALSRVSQLQEEKVKLEIRLCHVLHSTASDTRMNSSGYQTRLSCQEDSQNYNSSGTADLEERQETSKFFIIQGGPFKSCTGAYAVTHTCTQKHLDAGTPH